MPMCLSIYAFVHQLWIQAICSHSTLYHFSVLLRVKMWEVACAMVATATELAYLELFRLFFSVAINVSLILLNYFLLSSILSSF